MEISPITYQTFEGHPLPDSFANTLANIRKLHSDTITKYRPRRIGWKKHLERHGIHFTFAGINESGFLASDPFFSQVENFLKDAKVMWVCFGQLGKRFLERPEFVRGLTHAIKKNLARVYILTGPRHDPDTKTVFELAATGLIEIFPLEEYPSDHFLLIENFAGQKILIQESPHPETIRGRKNGELAELFNGFFRLFYNFVTLVTLFFIPFLQDEKYIYI